MEDRVLASESVKQTEFRVNVKYKKTVVNQLSKYKSLIKTLLDGQSQLFEDDKEKLSQEMLKNFELLVQENILVKGLPWEEAAEDDGEDCQLSILDDMLDENIVQTTRKRSIYPKKMLPYIVRSLKAERKLMGLFENTIMPKKAKRDPAQDTIMNNVSAAAPRMFKQASTVIKSLETLKQMAEGLHQVLNMQHSAETVEFYKDVFDISNSKGCAAQCSGVPVSRYTVKRAVSEAKYSMDYVPMPRITTTSAENS